MYYSPSYASSINYELSFQKPLDPSSMFKNQYKYNDKIINGQIYNDSLFKPDKRILTKIDERTLHNKKITKSELEYLSSLEFSCLLDMFSKKSINIPTSFNISLSSISFNTLANRNLMTCLLFLSWINPNFSYIITQVNIESKAFEVRLFIQGQPKSITLDSQLPVYNDKNKVKQPGFIITTEVNYWILLIEKAIAKVSKGYGNSFKLLSSEIFPLITDIPLIEIIHNENNTSKLWNLFLKAARRDWILFTEIKSSNGFNSKLEDEEFLSVFIIKAFEINKNKYLELSVPFIKENSQLRQIIQSNFFCEEYNNELYFPNNKKKSKMVMFINFDFFFKFFTHTYFLKQEKDFIYTYNRYTTIPSHTHVVKMKLSDYSKITLVMQLEQEIYSISGSSNSLSLNKNRESKESKEENIKESKHIKEIKDTPLGKIFVAKVNYDTNNLLTYINSSFIKLTKHILEMDLQEGDYYIFYKIYSEEEENIVISTYSEIKPVFLIEETRNTNFIKNFYMYSRSLFNSFLEKMNVRNFIENNQQLVITTSFIEMNFGFKVIKLENLTEDEILHTNITYKELTLISHKEKFSDNTRENTRFNSKLLIKSNSITDSKEFFITIYPKSTEVIVFEYQSMNENILFNIKFSIEKIKVECAKAINDNKLGLMKTYLKPNLYYFEVKFKKSKYLYIVNDSELNYSIIIFFSNLKNVRIIKPNVTNGNKLNDDNLIGHSSIIELDLTIYSKKKDYILMKANEFENEITYCADFEIRTI